MKHILSVFVEFSGIVLIFEFVIYEVEFSYLALGLFMVSVGCAVYVYWHTKISVIISNVDIESRKAQTQEQAKTELIKSEKRIFQEDLCFEINMKLGRENRPLMIVTFKKSKNFDVDKHEWVPKLSASY